VRRATPGRAADEREKTETEERLLEKYQRAGRFSIHRRLQLVIRAQMFMRLHEENHVPATNL
jgi:hypothetical protein